MSTHATFLEENYINNFKPKNKVIFEELDSAQDPPKSPVSEPIILLFSVHVQRGGNENISKGEQTQEEPVVEQQSDIQMEPKNEIQNN